MCAFGVLPLVGALSVHGLRALAKHGVVQLRGKVARHGRACSVLRLVACSSGSPCVVVRLVAVAQAARQSRAVIPFHAFARRLGIGGKGRQFRYVHVGAHVGTVAGAACACLVYRVLYFAVHELDELRRRFATAVVVVHVAADVGRHFFAAFRRIPDGDRAARALLVGEVKGGRGDGDACLGERAGVVGGEALCADEVGFGVATAVVAFADEAVGGAGAFGELVQAFRPGRRGDDVAVRVVAAVAAFDVHHRVEEGVARRPASVLALLQLRFGDRFGDGRVRQAAVVACRFAHHLRECFRPLPGAPVLPAVFRRAGEGFVNALARLCRKACALKTGTGGLVAAVVGIYRQRHDAAKLGEFFAHACRHLLVFVGAVGVAGNVCGQERVVGAVARHLLAHRLQDARRQLVVLLQPHHQGAAFSGSHFSLR